MHTEGTHNGNTLLLPAGKLGRIGICLFRQPHSFQKLHGFLFRFFLRSLQKLYGGQRHVLQNRLVRKKIEMLEYHADMLPVQVNIGFRIRDILSFKKNLSAGRLLQQVEGTEEGGLPGAGRPYYNHYLSLGYGRIDIFKDFNIPEGFAKIPDFK